MTTPTRPIAPNVATGTERTLGLQSPIADQEWQGFLQRRKELLDTMMNEGAMTARQLGLAPPDALQQAQSDPSSMTPVDPSISDPQRKDLLSRAQFWNIPNAEQMDSQTLLRAIGDKRAGIKRDLPEGGLNTFGLALGAASVAAAGATTRLLANAVGQVEGIPFAGKLLTDIFNTERARTWLQDVSSKADEDVQAIQARMPAQDLTAFQFTTGAGKMVGYALPAIAAVATHVSAPDRKGEDRETDRPPEDEAEDHQHDPAGVKADRGTTPAVLPVASIVVVAFSGGHRSPSLV